MSYQQEIVGILFIGAPCILLNGNKSLNKCLFVGLVHRLLNMGIYRQYTASTTFTELITF